MILVHVDNNMGCTLMMHCQVVVLVYHVVVQLLPVVLQNAYTWEPAVCRMQDLVEKEERGISLGTSYSRQLLKSCLEYLSHFSTTLSGNLYRKAACFTLSDLTTTLEYGNATDLLSEKHTPAVHPIDLLLSKIVKTYQMRSQNIYPVGGHVVVVKTFPHKCLCCIRNSASPQK